MNNLPLQPLPWESVKYSGGAANDAQGAGIYYRAIQRDGKHIVYWVDSMGGSDGDKSFDSWDELKEWVETTHYPHKMQPYVKPDSITDIANWFKKAKPEPTAKDITTQIGCHYEEVSEMDCSLYVSNRNHTAANLFKEAHSQPDFAENMISDLNHIELLDALCDQIVTATGVAYMMGFDIEGALKEVIRSNNSKMVDGKFIFDDNGKIAKPDSYSEPDLTPFISTMQNNKGE